MKAKFLVAVFLFAIGINGFTQTPMPASSEVMKKALEQARKEKKNVMLIFHASWCGWCKKMEASLADSSCKKMFDDNYVIATLDVQEQPPKINLENPGAADELKKYHGEKSGLPFWVVLDAKGKLLADSQIRPDGTSITEPGQNIGCPANEKEVAYFKKILKATSRLKDNDLEIIAKRFAQNEENRYRFQSKY